MVELKKFTKTWDLTDYEILTDTGFENVEKLHETIPYEVYELKLIDGRTLRCADNHIVFDSKMNEIFVKNLKNGDIICALDEDKILINDYKVESVIPTGVFEQMYDFELSNDSNHRYLTNGILSHNTELAKRLAEHVYGDSDALIKIDMSEYMESHSVSKLVGAPPGYIGYEQGGQLTEKVRRKPYCVVLFDEIEKAHQEVFNIMLQMLDEGHLTDSLGRKVNFKNTMIIMTSNIGAQELSTFGTSVGFSTTNTVANQEAKNQGIIEKALKKKFRPEFLNRIDDTIIFNSLKPEDINKIIYNEIKKLEDRLSENGYKIKMEKEAVDFLAKQGYDAEYGARPLTRTIQRYVEDSIADEMLSGNISEGDTIKVDFDKENEKIIISSVKTKKGKKND